MADKKIRMNASIASSDSVWNIGDELVLGRDIPEELALAYVLFPEHEPRATAIGWDPRPRATERAAEVAEHPAVDVRETAEAAPPVRRRRKPAS